MFRFVVLSRARGHVRSSICSLCKFCDCGAANTKSGVPWQTDRANRERWQHMQSRRGQSLVALRLWTVAGNTPSMPCAWWQPATVCFARVVVCCCCSCHGAMALGLFLLYGQVPAEKNARV